MDNIDFSGQFGTVYSCPKINLIDVIDDHAPVITKKIAIMSEAPWFDKVYRDLKSKRRSAEKKWKSMVIGNPFDFLIYKDLCNDVTTLANTKKISYFTEIVKKSNNNPKTLFRLVNKALDRKQCNAYPDCSQSMSELATEFNINFSSSIRLGKFVLKWTMSFYQTSVDSLAMIPRQIFQPG